MDENIRSMVRSPDSNTTEGIIYGGYFHVGRSECGSFYVLQKPPVND